MFTIICNVVLWIEVIGGVAVSVAASVFFGEKSAGGGVLAFFICFIGFLILFSLEGLFIEMGKNIKACRDALERFYSNASYNSQSPTQNANVGYFAPTVARNSWDCPKCGNMNGLTHSYCVHCGFRRPQ